MTDTITIVAGGWSASRFNLAKLPGQIIAVNDSARYLPRCDIAISMDRLWAENRVEQIKRLGIPLWLRRSASRSIEDFPLLTRFDNDHESTTLSDAPGVLNGTHSGFCALNLAYQMKPRAIILIGFDMAHGPRGERHWFPDYPWKNGGGSSVGKLAEWATQFETAARQLLASQIAVYVAGKTPGCFQRIDRDALEREAECAA